MAPHLSLLAAALLAAQTQPSEVQVINPVQGGTRTYVYPSDQGLVPQPRPSLFPWRNTGTTTVMPTQPNMTDTSRPILSKLQGIFGRRTEPAMAPMEVRPYTVETPRLVTTPPSVVKPGTVIQTPAPAPPTSEFPKKMPTSSLTPAAAATVSAVSHSTIQSAHTPVLAVNANRIGRDEKFEWVTGQLEVENGVYKIYYATPETVDPHNGVVQLNPQQIDLRQFRAGDLVSARGQLVQRLRTAPIYQVTSVTLIERPKTR